MTKPTLQDFLEDPDIAILNGYSPDFMSCGALMANVISFKTLKQVYKSFLDIFTGYVISMPKNILLFILNASIFTIYPFVLFPIFWILCFILRKNNIKKIKEKDSQLHALLGD